VTGTIGDGALGLAVRAAERDPTAAASWIGGLTATERGQLRGRYLLPQPRTALAEAVAAHASAAMDVSDGLAGDLAKLLKVSGVGATVAADAVPLSAAARSALRLDPLLRLFVFTHKAAYEILMTCRPGAFAPLAEAAETVGVPCTRIGEVTASAGFVVRDGQGNTLDLGPGRFEHF